MSERYLWACIYCGCTSATQQEECPNNCPQEPCGERGTIETIRGHKNWCKEKLKQGDCDCGFRTIIKCQGFNGKCDQAGKRRRQNTRYEEDDRNYVIMCDECFVENEKYWDYRWKELYSGYFNGQEVKQC